MADRLEISLLAPVVQCQKDPPIFGGSFLYLSYLFQGFPCSVSKRLFPIVTMQWEKGRFSSIPCLPPSLARQV